MSANAPCLRSDLSIIPQTFRGETSYVVKDHSAQKYFRFGSAEVRVMRCFDGRQTPAEIAAALAAEGLRISQQAVEGFARTLAGAGFLERTTAERSTLQIERLRAERKQRRKPRLFRGELLRMRWSFGDPDAWLTRTLPLVSWMFTRTFALASVVFFSVYLWVLGEQWSEFSAAVGATFGLHAITWGTIVTLWVTAGLVILIHELGHAYACKYFGGEVRELGFMMLYFQPSFFCNVSDAWSFPERRARLWVTAAGSWIQLVVASMAALLWRAAAPDTLIATVALSAMLVGGLTALFTNANPLLPLDGYFALSDWLEIPNLRHRAFAHFQWWVKRVVFRLELPEPAATVHERRVFLIYGALATAYIAGLFAFLGAIVFGWAGRALGVAGVIAAAAVALVLMRSRIVDWGRTTLLAVRAHGGVLRGRRRLLLAGVGAALLLLLLLPWTLTSTGEFVVRPASTSNVNAPDSGIVAAIFISEGMRVDAGTPLLRIMNHSLEQETLSGIRTVDSLTMSESGARSAGRAGDAARLLAEREAAVASLAALERRAEALTLRAASAGVVTTPRTEELIGRRVDVGASLLSIAALDSVEIRIALSKGGGTRVRAGQVMHAISYANVAAPWTTSVAEASMIADRAGFVEARVRRTPADGWRAGTKGEASVELRRSNLLGGLWWKARQLLRVDLWL